MKACLMKVNYDPKYTHPHTHPSAPKSDKSGANNNPLHARLTLTKEIYGPALPERKHLRETLEDAAKRKIHRNSAPTTDSKEIARIQADAERAHIDRYKKSFEESKRIDPYLFPHKLLREKENRLPLNKYEKHKEGVAQAYSTIKLQPLKTQQYNDKNGPQPVWSKGSPTGSTAEPKPVHDPESGYQRSKTCVPGSQSAPGYHHNYRNKHAAVRSSSWIDLERRARVEAERAMKSKKIFTILGPYTSLRQALRRRGWVEKFQNAPALSETMAMNSNTARTRKSVMTIDAGDDDDDSSGSRDVRPPWEEESGLYNIMSHAVRNYTPALVFAVKCTDVDSKVVKSNQLVNHFGKTRHITTKVGLCQNLRSVPWYDTADPHSFFPRCYMMEEDDDRQAFIEDYRLTAVFGFLRFFVDKYKNKIEQQNNNNSSSKKSPTEMKVATVNIGENAMQIQHLPPTSQPSHTMPKSGGPVSVRALEVAMEQTEMYLKSRDHEDIDVMDNYTLTDTQWDQFIMWYYQFVHDNGDLNPVNEVMVADCEELLNKLADCWPQAHLDGTRNIWILKPCAKSRGRGIQIFDKLGMMMGYVDSNEGKVVLQKYIERPLLIHNTKFDIRQWFLVTDWNPLTLWFYQDSYVRFCSQQYTLDDLHISIHLSNNSVQKNFKNGSRAEELPTDNMWSSHTFQQYLQEKGHENAWEDVIYPGMKQAIVCSLLCTQEHIEDRKAAFEVYGADFMVTEDMRPWLLEINSSPSMSRSTPVTQGLVDAMLEDTLKVVLDRKSDKSCDIGRYELAFKQQTITDRLHSDPSLFVQGKRIAKKGGSKSMSFSSGHSSKSNIALNGQGSKSQLTSPSGTKASVYTNAYNLRANGANGMSSSKTNLSSRDRR